MSQNQSYIIEARKLFAEYRRLEIEVDTLERQGDALIEKYRVNQLKGIDQSELLDEINQNFQQQQIILKQLYGITARLGVIFQEQANLIKEKL